MDLYIDKQELKGKINVIGSKSIAHRAIVSALISEGVTELTNVNMCDDVMNTLNIVRETTEVEVTSSSIKIKGFNKEINKKTYIIDESMSTFNLLFPTLTYYSKNEIVFKLGHRLKERIKNEYKNLYIGREDVYYVEDNDQIIVKGFPIEKALTISNQRTSQCVSGVLFLLSTLKKDFEIKIDSENSLSYIDMTIEVLKKFGKNIYRKENSIFVMHNQIMKSITYNIESDGSYYLMLLALYSNNPNLEIVSNNFLFEDPDYQLAEKIKNNNLIVEDVVDLKDNPDAVFSIATLALNKTTPTKLVNIDRLKGKESDRTKSLEYVLSSFGVEFVSNNNEITIYPSKPAKAKVDSFNDHRVAMMELTLLLNASGVINKVDCVDKSAPNLLNDLKKVGFKAFEFVTCLEEKLENETATILFKENLINTLDKIDKTNKCVVVTDENIPNEYIQKISSCFENVVVYKTTKCGEDAKTIDEYTKLCEFLLNNNISKSDYIVALGGGTITDLVGYVAATYKRGMNLILVPTTLLSMVDASIGFKCGINVGETKNAIGAFKAPKFVFVDPNLLKTLPKNEIKSGFAEIIKIFALRSPKLFYQVFDGDQEENLSKWILEAIKLKLDYVLIDPYDKSIRHALNFGHTYGHAFELKENIKHGDAIAKGMRIFNNSIELKKLLDKMEYKEASLCEVDEAKKIIQNDKKIENNNLKAIYLKEIGEYETKNYKL